MFSRKAAILAVTLVLALSWCAAAARPAFSLPARAKPSPSLEQLRAGFWIWLTGTWAKAGCVIDPGGKPACGPASVGGAKEGCIIDPNGKPACSPTGAGASALAAPTSSADEGCGIDPGGSPCGRQQ